MVGGEKKRGEEKERKEGGAAQRRTGQEERVNVRTSVQTHFLTFVWAREVSKNE